MYNICDQINILKWPEYFKFGTKSIKIIVLKKIKFEKWIYYYLDLGFSIFMFSNKFKHVAG